jgi:hypothetical protein
MNIQQRYLTIIAFIALTGTACSKTPAKTPSDGSNTVTPRDQAVRFAACVRKNGVRDFPDPNASGEFVYGVSVSPAVFSRAVEACKSLQPAGTLSVKRGPEQQKASNSPSACAITV